MVFLGNFLETIKREERTLDTKSPLEKHMKGGGLSHSSEM